jgi:hypothetical protein
VSEKTIILSLCDASGNWSQPYADDPDYKVVRIDLAQGKDVRLLKFSPGVRVHGILAAPPCTHMCTAGSPSYRKKGNEAILEALAIVDACIRLVHVYRPEFYAIENPPGRLKHWLGDPAWSFQPWEYGGYLAVGEKSIKCPLLPAQDGYTKRTCIWGTAKKPEPKPVEVTLPPKPKGHGFRTPCFYRHDHHRSVTPMGFARAFKAANP